MSTLWHLIIVTVLKSAARFLSNSVEPYWMVWIRQGIGDGRGWAMARRQVLWDVEDLRFHLIFRRSDDLVEDREGARSARSILACGSAANLAPFMRANIKLYIAEWVLITHADIYRLIQPNGHSVKAVDILLQKTVCISATWHSECMHCYCQQPVSLLHFALAAAPLS